MRRYKLIRVIEDGSRDFDGVTAYVEEALRTMPRARIVSHTHTPIHPADYPTSVWTFVVDVTGD